MSRFAFLEREWAAVFDAAVRAEAVVHADPRTACFYARRALELAVAWALKHDAAVLYESPFTDLTPQGPDGLFSSAQVDELVGVLESVKASAMAA